MRHRSSDDHERQLVPVLLGVVLVLCLLAPASGFAQQAKKGAFIDGEYVEDYVYVPDFITPQELKKSIDEVSRLQQDASKAVEDLATGKSENVTGVMTAMEKSDLAFKTLLAIRSKLMEAYDEIKGISV